jgi:hypothetical protein
MSKEQIGYIEQEKKKQELSEQEKKDALTKKLEHNMKKDVLLQRLEGQKNLSFLRSFIERGLIEPSTVEQMLNNSSLDGVAIAEIFEKLDALESIENIDTIFPKNYRISKDEYLRALEDPAQRIQTLTKIDDSLVFIFHSMNPYA